MSSSFDGNIIPANRIVLPHALTNGSNKAEFACWVDGPLKLLMQLQAVHLYSGRCNVTTLREIVVTLVPF